MLNLPPDWEKYGFWGVAGGVAVLGLELWTSIRALDGNWPVRCTRVAYWFGEAARLLIGGILAVALGGAAQVTVPLGAFTVGVATPLVLARLAENVPRFDGKADPRSGKNGG